MKIGDKIQGSWGGWYQYDAMVKDIDGDSATIVEEDGCPKERTIFCVDGKWKSYLPDGYSGGGDNIKITSD